MSHITGHSSYDFLPPKRPFSNFKDGEVTAAEPGIIAGVIGIVFLFIFLLIQGSVKNRKSRSHIPKKDRKQRLSNDPDLNIKDWDLHRERLNTFGRSKYR